LVAELMAIRSCDADMATGGMCGATLLGPRGKHTTGAAGFFGKGVVELLEPGDSHRKAISNWRISPCAGAAHPMWRSFLL